MISIITPTVRPEMLPIILKCLKRQTIKNFEWIIVCPESIKEDIKKILPNTYIVILTEPPKNEGDYYGLNKAYNEAFRHAKGELIVSIQDGLWFDPTLLEKFWYHYQANPKACVGAIGNQYNEMLNGKPENLVWKDPRQRQDLGSFYEVDFPELEWAICSFPKQAVFDAGGIDEEYDKYAALSEKDLNHRMSKLGYKFYLDQSIEYRAVKHPRLNEQWEERYLAGCEVYIDHGKEIIEGKRLKLSYL